MPNKDSSQSVLPAQTDSVEAVDVGENSNAYSNDADRQAVHDAYERGNEVAAEKNEPVFDNRVGFTIDVHQEFDLNNEHREVNQTEPASPSVENEQGLNNPSAPAPVVSSSTPQPDSSEKNNDSTVAPEKSTTEALRGFHGG